MRLQCIAQRTGKLVTFLRTELKLSANLTQKLSKQGALSVNDKQAGLYQKIQTGDRIAVHIQEALPGYPPEKGPLPIVYEDEAVLVVDKPSGLTMCPTAARPDGTVAGWLIWHYQETGQRCGIHFVNRLDRDTLGLVLVAKNGFVHGTLSKAMASGAVEKVYHAAVYGVPEQPIGEIVQPIGRVEGDPLLRCVRPDGQYAKSTYQVLKTAGNCSLLELHPVTGRTNQLRIHCAWAGWPILGDGQYGTAASMHYSKECGYTTQQLCCTELAFPHPLRGEILVVTSRQTIPLPEEGAGI